jgi:SAM-dependent methyltransferase
VITFAPDRAELAYDTLATHYETFTRDYDHRTWLRRLDALARTHGLRGGRVLDVACGTGKSLRALLELGYEVTGCDISAAMLEVARAATPEVVLRRADMRALPELGRFDWVTCLDDALNYLLDDDDLALALASMGRQLRPGGLLCFDLNTLSAHRDGFSATWVVEGDGRYLCWRGCGAASTSGEPGAAEIDIFVREDDGWSRTLSRHEQRWWSAGDVRRAADAAGLEPIARYGQLPGAVLEPAADEERHTKSVFFLRRPARPCQEGGAT